MKPDWLLDQCIADLQAVEDGLSGRGNPPYGKYASFGDGSFDGASGILFDEEPVGRIAQREDFRNGDRRDFDSREAFALLTELFGTGLVRSCVGGRHGDGLRRPEVRFQTARAFVRVLVEPDERTGFAHRRDGRRSEPELGNGRIRIFSVVVRVFEFVLESSGNGDRARSQRRTVSVNRLSKIMR